MARPIHTPVVKIEIGYDCYLFDSVDEGAFVLAALLKARRANTRWLESGAAHVVQSKTNSISLSSLDYPILSQAQFDALKAEEDAKGPCTRE